MAVHAPCDQLGGTPAVFLPSDHTPKTSAFQDSTGNLEGGTDYLLRVISFGREVLPHSYLAGTGPD